VEHDYLENLFHYASVPVIVWDTVCKITRCNHAFELLTGYSEEEVLGKELHMLFPEANRDKSLSKVKSALTGVQWDSVEIPILRKDGDTRILVWNSANIYAEDGKTFLATIAQGIDITERKRVEEALGESEERYRKITEAVTDYVFRVNIKDGQSSDTIHGPACVSVTGYTSEEFASDPYLWFRMVHEKDRAKVREQTSQIYSKKKGQPIEHRIIRKDGNCRWVINTAVLHFDEKGELISYDGLIRDITDRKKAEEALRESERFSSSLLNNSPNPIIVINQDTSVRYVNPALEELTGFSSAELIGRKAPYPWWTEEALRKTSKDFKEALRKGALRLEEPFQKNDGEKFCVEVTSVPIKDNGKFEYYLANWVDITERKQVEKEREKMQTQLRLAQRMEAIGTLAGGIAHDFNNILAAIIGYAEMALYSVSKDSTLRHQLEQVVKAGNRAKNLVIQILTFTRQTEQERKPVMVKPIIKEALKLLRASIPTTIKIRQHIEVESDIILEDPTQVHQVLINLCTNAAHAMHEKGGVLEVSLTDVSLDSSTVAQYPDLSPGHYLKLTVSDTGYGMDHAVVERIYDPFFTTKEPGEGTGMGLSVVHGIIKSLGGAITVESKPVEGTTFHILFPRSEKDITVEAEVLSPIPMGKESILFVDDEKDIVRMGQQMLERLGYKVIARKGSIEALEAFRKQPDRFDLVITDQTMPNMTGDELAKELIQVKPGIPVILCTGFSEKITLEKAKNIGIQELLMKPIAIRDLAETIRWVLDGGKEV